MGVGVPPTAGAEAVGPWLAGAEAVIPLVDAVARGSARPVAADW
jgi:hypothetical protein